MSTVLGAKTFEEIWKESEYWRNNKVDKEDLKTGKLTNGSILPVVFEELSLRPGHQCYWNDRFAIAVLLNLPWDILQSTAWCAINNGLSGYWEWETHGGYYMQVVMEKLGIEMDDDTRRHTNFNYDGYSSIRIAFARQLGEYFELPSKFLRPSFKPDYQTEEKIRQLWGGYTHSQNDYFLERVTGQTL